MDRVLTPAQLAEAERMLAEAATHYLTLSKPSWKSPGSTAPPRDPDEEFRPGPLGSKPPVNLTVIDFLMAADRQVAALESEVRSALGRIPSPCAPSAPAKTAGAFATLARELPNLPSPLAARTAEAAYALHRRSSVLLGLVTPVHHITTCPHCESPSIILSPHNDDIALCANAECRDPDVLDEDGQPARRQWSRYAGEWSLLGWDRQEEDEPPAPVARGARGLVLAALGSLLLLPGLHLAAPQDAPPRRRPPVVHVLEAAAVR